MKWNIEEISIIELLEYVNKKLREGSSISKVERELKLGKDTLRKKLNRANYIYDKKDKQFKINNNAISKETQVVSNDSIKNDNKKIIKETKSNNNKKQSKLSEFDIEIQDLKELINIKDELIELVKNTRNNKGISIIEAMSFDKANRKKATFNLDLGLLEKLKEYEKCNNISKSDVVNIAIKNYLISEGITKE